MSDSSAAAPARFGSNPQERKRLDRLTAAHTAFSQFVGLLNARGDYRPSLICLTAEPALRRVELLELANAYDAAQAARNNTRRVARS